MPDQASPSCAICLEDIVNDAGALYDAPCCGARASESSVQFHATCVRAMCSMSTDGVAACPRCRSAIKARESRDRETPVTFVAAEATNVCVVCRQRRALGTTCDACGGAVRLRYVCERCGRTQVIPHPMWRYMPSGPFSVSAQTWACHRGCGDYTRWTVHPEDAARVPRYDVPRGWGNEEEWYAAIRDEMERRARTPRRESGWLVVAAVVAFCAFVVAAVFANGGEGGDANVQVEATRAYRTVTTRTRAIHSSSSGSTRNSEASASSRDSAAYRAAAMRGANVTAADL